MYTEYEGGTLLRSS